MPPHVPRKRLREDSPVHHIVEKPAKKSKTTPVKAPESAPKPSTSTRRKATLFDDLDATASTGTSRTRPSRGKAIVNASDESDSDDASSLSSLSSAAFEDVAPASKSRASRGKAAALKHEDPSDDDDVEFEDVSYPTLAPQQATTGMDLTLSHIAQEAYTAGKKGPSKKERRARMNTHCMHVQYLMWHNAVRNSWSCDPLVQGIMLSHLPAGMWSSVEKWRRSMGLETEVKPVQKKKKTNESVNGKGRPKSKRKGEEETEEKRAKDWGDAAQRLASGQIDMSHGDPLIHLLTTLSCWWRQRFRITAPGLRKTGYLPVKQCVYLNKSFDERKLDMVRHGERIDDLEWFRLRAQRCCGSRDVGAQLFTALLRALGIESRMVANLQPIGFGWTKAEEANPQARLRPEEPSMSGKDEMKREDERKLIKAELSGSEDDELGVDNSDDDSVIEIPRPSSNKPKSPSFDKDLDYPHYWTEALSPATNRYIPVDAFVKKKTCATRADVEMLEPRGAKAEKAKQVMAYVVGHSADGSAKDVTVRYLKAQTWPGRTKGMRLPSEKVPIYDRNGRVKRYDKFDWFQSVMRGYVRGSDQHPTTAIDTLEDSTDLKASEPRKKEVKEGEETLQFYKSSKDFVLARHLKREEALLPGTKSVKSFRNKGGKKGEPAEEAVYSRMSVVQVKSAETWHKQGRAPKNGEKPLKSVPYRVATTTRRRQIAEMEARSGEKALQGLYSWDQTDWIIPPPIKDGIIPKNGYGNIDLFVEHMLPQGAVHLPYRTAMRVCKRLEIDYAEAVVDFEFGRRMAIPVISGVVIAEAYRDQAMEEIEKEEAERMRKEDEKKRKVVLAMWRKLMMGMRILERIARDHGDVVEGFHAFGHAGATKQADGEAEAVEGMEGGFLPEGFEYEAHDEEEGEQKQHATTSAFFDTPIRAGADDSDDDDEGEDMLVVEDGSTGGKAYPTPSSAGGSANVTDAGWQDRGADDRKSAPLKEVLSDEDGFRSDSKSEDNESNSDFRG